MSMGRFTLEVNNNCIRITCCDYYDDYDYEFNYSFDEENTMKFLYYLYEKGYRCHIDEAIREEFGVYLEKKSIKKVCDANGIEYQLFTWMS